MTKVPFNQRFGLLSSKPIDNDVPQSARIALASFLYDLENRGYLLGPYVQPLYDELRRSGRLTGEDLEFDSRSSFLDNLAISLIKMEWWQIYNFLERIYARLLVAGEHQQDETVTEVVSIADVQKYYVEELNIILAEENIAFYFVDGEFQRRGRAQTQKSIQRVGMVLSSPALSEVKSYFNKARKFFDERPEPDVENCIKEALCALEACIEILTGRATSNDFTKVVRQLQGNDLRSIPAPFVESLIKLHAYRGSGQGVAHAALSGTKVSELEAELVLNLVASYITYLVDLLSEPEGEIPF